jgi:fatty acid desaturase
MAAAWQAAVTREELQRLRTVHASRAWLSIAVDWGLVAASCWAVVRWPNPLTIVGALFVIGARQLGLAILMHDAAHRALFRNRRLNDVVGNWLCAYPVLSDLRPYRPYHLQHHAKNWTADDPDLSLAQPFPITRRSLWRKVRRDLSGQTGWKRLRATLRTRAAVDATVQRNFDAGREALWGVLVTNAVLLALMTLAGHPALYLLWVGAWLTTYSLVMRVRSIAEHAVPLDAADELTNTRTTLATWWERLLVAPNRVNFHLEHHLVPTIPHYHLPAFHRLLRARGVLDRACVARGYAAVLARATSRAA